MNVSLTPELATFVKSRVQSGRYQTDSEVVREGLRLLEERESAREAVLEEMKEKIRIGIAQADKGEFIDGEDVFKAIRKLSQSRRRGEK